MKQNSNIGARLVYVNGVPHQAIQPPTGGSRLIYERVYDRIAVKHLNQVLIVGAGTGNDVALALARGAGHVDGPGLGEVGGC